MEKISNMKMRIIFIGLIVLIVGILFYSYKFCEDVEMTIEVRTILKFDDMKKKVFLKARSWGISGNHEEITLSEKDKTIPDKKIDYIFYTSEIFYKIEGDGRLIIYAPEGSVSEPLKKFKDVDVVINKLTTAEEIKDYNRHFRKYGLERISIYFPEKSLQK